MSTRADKFTQLQKTPDLFSDFLVDLTPHPITKDLARLKNEASIKRSVRNLVLTSTSERMFQPSVGGNIRRVLFEPNDDIVAEELSFQIRNTLTNNEPRVSVFDVQVSRDQSGDTVNVVIFFIILNNQSIQSVDLILKRIR